MILLNKNEFTKLTAPLQQLPINILFARAVVEHKVSGTIYVDEPASPKTFYVVHPYGMSLLFGDYSNAVFNAAFHDHALNTGRLRSRHEWMQAYPNDWHTVLEGLFGESMLKAAENSANQEHGIVELNTRVNFRFNRKRFMDFHPRKPGPEITIVKTDGRLFREMKGTVVPEHFWANEDDFLRNGLAFSLLYKDELASMAFSSYWFGDQFELGIETKPGFRGRGFAELVCAAIIDHCIDNGYEPIWSCRLENTASYYLAQKLGFEPVLESPYYRLSN